MKSTYKILAKQLSFILAILSLIGLSSCGSYHNVSQNDGIYDARDYSVYQEQQVEKQKVYDNNEAQEDNFFAKKLASYETVEDSDVLTDIDNYKYEIRNNNENNNPWGYNSNVTINIVDPYYYRNTWNSYYYYDDYYYSGYYPYSYYPYNYYRPYYNPYYYSYNPYYYGGYYAPYYYGSGFYIGYSWGYNSYYNNRYYRPTYHTKYYDSYGKRDSYNTGNYNQRNSSVNNRNISPYSETRRPTIGTSTRRTSDDIRSERSRTINNNSNRKIENNSSRQNNDGNNSYRRPSENSNSGNRSNSTTGRRKDNSVSYYNNENQNYYSNQIIRENDSRNTENYKNKRSNVSVYQTPRNDSSSNYSNQKSDTNRNATNYNNRNSKKDSSNKRLTNNTNNYQKTEASNQINYQRVERETTRYEAPSNNPVEVRTENRSDNNSNVSNSRRRD